MTLGLDRQTHGTQAGFEDGKKLREAAGSCGEHLDASKHMPRGQSRHDTTTQHVQRHNMCNDTTCATTTQRVPQRHNMCHNNTTCAATRQHVPHHVTHAICNKTQAIGNNICNKREEARKKRRRQERRERRQEGGGKRRQERGGKKEETEQTNRACHVTCGSIGEMVREAARHLTCASI